MLRVEVKMCKISHRCNRFETAGIDELSVESCHPNGSMSKYLQRFSAEIDDRSLIFLSDLGGVSA
jgi:hypothetical protein